jgi:hypothetical protein
MYTPRISDINIRRLYQLKKELKKPMTHLLDEILNHYFASWEKQTETEEAKKISNNILSGHC